MTRTHTACGHSLEQLPREYEVDDPQDLPFRNRAANKRVWHHQVAKDTARCDMSFRWRKDSPKQALDLIPVETGDHLSAGIVSGRLKAVLMFYPDGIRGDRIV